MGYDAMRPYEYLDVRVLRGYQHYFRGVSCSPQATHCLARFARMSSAIPSPYVNILISVLQSKTPLITPFRRSALMVLFTKVQISSRRHCPPSNREAGITLRTKSTAS